MWVNSGHIGTRVGSMPIMAETVNKYQHGNDQNSKTDICRKQTLRQCCNQLPQSKQRRQKARCRNVGPSYYQNNYKQMKSLFLSSSFLTLCYIEPLFALVVAVIVAFVVLLANQNRERVW